MARDLFNATEFSDDTQETWSQYFLDIEGQLGRSLGEVERLSIMADERHEALALAVSKVGAALAGGALVASGTVTEGDLMAEGYALPHEGLWFDSFAGVVEGPALVGCEVDRIWDEDGRLFVSGLYQNGVVTVEARVLPRPLMDAWRAAMAADGGCDVARAREIWDRCLPPLAADRVMGPATDRARPASRARR